MRRFYLFAAAVIVAVTVALGTYAATTSARLGLRSASPQSVSTTVAQGNQRLNTAQAALNQALAARPPVAQGGRVPFVTPHPIVVNVSGSAGAVAYAPQPAHFSEGGEQGD
ncbi:MAG: hypothetical protein ACYDHO_02065 [Gaiellaceae bacterium]